MSQRNGAIISSCKDVRPVFHSFDCAYVLNLDEDRERMERMSCRLGRLEVPFDRFPALRASRETRFEDSRITSGAYACAETHAALLRLILQRKHDNALILEDDVVFRDDTQELMEGIASDLNSQSWDVFYMGLHLIHSGVRLSRRVGQVKLGFHAHAYAVSRTAIPRLLRCIEKMLENPVQTFDGYQDESLVKLYAIPILAIQEPNISYTFGRHVDRLPQYFSIFDGNEFEQHCVEMKTWHSDWRKILEFGRTFGLANKSYKGGSLEAAAGDYLTALAQWPELRTELSQQPEFPRIIRTLSEPHAACDEQLLNACTSLVALVYRAWPF